MRLRSKRYNKDAAIVSKEKLSLEQALKKLKGWQTTKFNQTIEIVMNLGIDPKNADQAIRGAISLPHGIGKTLKVIAFCDGAEDEAAKAAGAIEAGAEDLVKKITDGWLDFDVAIAHPKMMGQVGKLGRILGPQGKMPSPKSGTVTPQVAEAVREYAAGKVEFRNDAGGNVHGPVGKMNFEEQKLSDNINAFIDRIKRMKPSGSKGAYINKICLCGTMTPSVELDITVHV
jgi:large subunit ribosomal protein L1